MSLTRHPVFSPLLRYCALAVLSITSACGDGPVEPSLLEQSRVVAVRSVGGSLAPGTDNTLEALVFEAEALSWRGCPFPWIPPNPELGYEALTCVFGETPLGEGNPLTFPVPDGVEELWIAIDGTSTSPAATPLLTTLFRFRADSPSAAAEPFTASTMSEGVVDNAELTTIAAGASIDMAALLGPSHDERAVVNWYTTGGLFEPFRSFGTDPSELTAPDEPGEITLFVVLRNPDDGVAWYTTTVTVTEAAP